MPKAPKTPRARTETPKATKRPRPPFNFPLSEDRQILLAFIALANVPNPDMKELYRILGNDAYSLSTMKTRLKWLRDMSKELRADRQQMNEHRRYATEARNSSDFFDSDTYVETEAPTPSQSTVASQSPEVPAAVRSRHDRDRSSSPTPACHHRGRSASPVRETVRPSDRRGRGREAEHETRRGVSTHTPKRQQAHDNQRPAHDADERPRNGREETLPPKQCFRGRRDSGRGSRDQRRDRSPSTPNSALRFGIPVVEMRRRG